MLLFLEDSDDLDERDQIRFDCKPRRIMTRNTPPRSNYSQTTWSKMLRERKCADPESPEGKEFRKWFRVPMFLFEQILAIAVAQKWAAVKDGKRQFQVPLPIKILWCLRLLGRGLVFDDAREFAQAKMSTVHSWFHTFCRRMAGLLSEYVYPPTTSAEIRNVTETYRMVGLPGCIGSADVVHVGWDRCPAGLRSMFVGKEGVPTIAYEMVCDHRRRIISVTPGHPGARNDKTIVKFDGFIQALHDRQRYAECTFSTVGADGNVVQHTGLYLIVDGGYHRWRVLQCPYKHTSDRARQQFSSNLESQRKDIECTFGILKGRFRILKSPIRFHKKSEIDNVVFTCAVLHNMLLEYDYGHVDFGDNSPYLGEEGQFDEEDIGMRMGDMRDIRIVRSLDTSGMGGVYAQYIDTSRETERGWQELREHLVAHYWRRLKDTGRR